MGLFGKKKKKEKLPEFPKASDLPDIQEYGMDVCVLKKIIWNLY